MSDQRGNTGRRDGVGGKKFSSLNLNQTYRGNRHDVRQTAAPPAQQRQFGSLQSLGKIRNRPSTRSSNPEDMAHEPDVREKDDEDEQMDALAPAAEEHEHVQQPASGGQQPPSRSTDIAEEHEGEEEGDDDGGGWAGAQEEVDFNAKLTWSSDDDSNLSEDDSKKAARDMAQGQASKPTSAATKDRPAVPHSASPTSPRARGSPTPSSARPIPSRGGGSAGRPMGRDSGGGRNSLSRSPADAPAAHNKPLRSVPVSSGGGGGGNGRPPTHPPDFNQRHNEAPTPRRASFRDGGDWRGGASAPSPADEDQNWRSQAPQQSHRPTSFGGGSRHGSYGHDPHGFAGRDGHRNRDRDGPNFAGRDDHDQGRSRSGFGPQERRVSGGGSGGGGGGNISRVPSSDQSVGGQPSGPDHQPGPRGSGSAPPSVQSAGPVRIMQRVKSSDSSTDLAESPPPSAAATPAAENGRGATGAGKRALYNHHSGEFVPEPDKPRDGKKSGATGPEKRIAQRPATAVSSSRPSDDLPSPMESKADSERCPSASKADSERCHSASPDTASKPAGESSGKRGERNRQNSRASSPPGDGAAADGGHRRPDRSRSDGVKQQLPVGADLSAKRMSLDDVFSKSDGKRRSTRRQSRDKVDQLPPVVVRDGRAGASKDENGAHSKTSSPTSASAPAVGGKAGSDTGGHRQRKRMEPTEAGGQPSPMSLGPKAPGLGKNRSDPPVRPRPDQDRSRSKSVTATPPAASVSHSGGAKQRAADHSHGRDTAQEPADRHTSTSKSSNSNSSSSSSAPGKRQKQEVPDMDSPTPDQRPGQRRAKNERGSRSQQQHADDMRHAADSSRRESEDSHRHASGAIEGDSERHRSTGHEGKRSSDGRRSRDFPRSVVGPRLRNPEDNGRPRGGDEASRAGSSQRYEEASGYRRASDGYRQSAAPEPRRGGGARESRSSEDRGRTADSSSSHREQDGGRQRNSKGERHTEGGWQASKDRRRSTQKSSGASTPDSNRVFGSGVEGGSSQASDVVRPKPPMSPSAEVRHFHEVDGVPHESVISLKAVDADLGSLYSGRPASPSLPISLSGGAQSTVSKPTDLQLSSTDNSEEYNTPPSSMDEGLHGAEPASKTLPAAGKDAAPAGASLSTAATSGLPAKSSRSPSRDPSPVAKQRKSSSRRDEQRRASKQASASAERSSSRTSDGRRSAGTSGGKKSSISDYDLNSLNVCVVDDMPEPSSNTPLVDQDFCLFPDSVTLPNPEDGFQEVLPRGRKRKAAGDKPSKGALLRSPVRDMPKVSVRDGSPHRKLSTPKADEEPPRRGSVQKSSASVDSADGKVSRPSRKLSSPVISVSPALVEGSSAKASGQRKSAGVGEAPVQTATVSNANASTSAKAGTTTVSDAAAAGAVDTSAPMTTVSSTETKPASPGPAVQSVAAVTANSVTSQASDERLVQVQCGDTSTSVTASASSPSAHLAQPARPARSSSPKRRSPRSSPTPASHSPGSLMDVQPGSSPVFSHVSAVAAAGMPLQQNMVKMPLLGSSPASQAMHTQGHYAGAQQMVAVQDQHGQVMCVPMQVQQQQQQPVDMERKTAVIYQPMPGQAVVHHPHVLAHHVHPGQQQPQHMHHAHAPHQLISLDQAQQQQQQQQHQVAAAAARAQQIGRYPVATSANIATSPKYNRRPASQSSPLMQRQAAGMPMMSQSPPLHPKQQQQQMVYANAHMATGPAVAVAATAAAHSPQPQLVQVQQGILQQQQPQQQQQAVLSPHPQQQPQQQQQQPQPGQVAYHTVPHQHQQAASGEFFRHQGHSVVIGSPAGRPAMPLQAQPGKAAQSIPIMIPAQQARVAYAQQSPQMHQPYPVAGSAEQPRQAAVSAGLVRVPQYPVAQQSPHGPQISGSPTAYSRHVQVGPYAQAPSPQFRVQQQQQPGVHGQLAGPMQVGAAGQPLPQVAVVPAHFVPADQYSAGQPQPPRPVVAATGSPHAYGVMHQGHPQPVQLQSYQTHVRPGVPTQAVLVAAPAGYSVVASDPHHRQQYEAAVAAHAQHQHQQQARTHSRAQQQHQQQQQQQQQYSGLQSRRDNRHRAPSPSRGSSQSSAPTPPSTAKSSPLPAVKTEEPAAAASAASSPPANSATESTNT